MSVGYNEKKDTYNPRYEAWAANMLKASEAKRWNKIVDMYYKRGISVNIENVGCLHWAYYSIMNYLGKGTDLQYVLCYYEEGEVVPSDWLDFDAKSYTKGFYRTEGKFCISAILFTLFSIINIWLENWVDTLSKTFDSGNILYSMLSKFSFGFSWFVTGIFLFMLLLAIKSLIRGRRFIKYLLNIIFIILLFNGFGVVAVLILIFSALYYWGDGKKAGIRYRKICSKQNSSSTTTVSERSYRSVEDSAYEKQKKAQEYEMQWQKEKEREEYQKKMQEEKELRQKEDRRYRLLKEINSLKDKITILENKNKDLDAGYRAYQKGSWSYNVDPKLNRSTYESNLKEIDWLKKKIEKIDDELRRL